MLILFFIITLASIKIIHSVENNDTTFINSLPEKQKKEFLHKVEKRIKNEVPEVKSPEINDTNVDLYEKRLEDQGKSIQNILRSEIDILKTHNRRNMNFTDRREDAHIDLTLRAGKERSEAIRRENQGNNNMNIPVVVQYDSQDATKHESSPSSTPIKIQNKVTKVDKNESKTDEITWENISLNNKSVNVNDSFKNHLRIGRRSNEFDITSNQLENATASHYSSTEKSDNNANSSVDAVNVTSTVNNTSYYKDRAKDTKHVLDLSPNMNSLRIQNFTLDTLNNTNVKNLRTDHKMSTTTRSEVDTTNTSNSSSIEMQTKTGVVVDSTTQSNENLQTGHIFSTTQNFIDSKTNKPSPIKNNVDKTDGDVDTRSKMPDILSTTTDMVDNSINENTTVKTFTETTNNTVNTTQISNIKADARKDYHSTTEDPNEPELDAKSKEDIEVQPHYVPVYNYDPENAYYNANSQRPQGKVVQVDEQATSFINTKETHSTTANPNVYTNDNKKSLRVKDVKDRIMSNDKIQINSDLNDMIANEESSGDDLLIEKPLKHTLKKIRINLTKNKLKFKDDDNDIDLIQPEIEKVENDGVHTEEYEKESITELFTNFGALLQNLVDRSNNNKPPPSASEKDLDKDISDLDKNTYKDIAHSLENHNKNLKNTGIMQIFKTIKKIQNQLAEKSPKLIKDQVSKKKHQSRFHIKHGDKKYKHKQDKKSISSEQDIINSSHKFENQGQSFEKRANKINDEFLELHINILKDLIDRTDLGLKNYDWLGTTVAVRAGLAKLQQLAEKKVHHKKLHPLDKQLLEFTMKLHERAKELTEIQKSEQNVSARRKQAVSFHIPKVKRGKNFNRLHRMYGVRDKVMSRSRTNVEDFKEFLGCLEMCLDDLHTAIKQVSSITTYKKQHWFKNLKQLYLNSAKEKEHLGLFLHLVTARLINLMDETNKKMNREDDFMTKDKVAVDRIEVEYVLVLRICNKMMEFK